MKQKSLILILFSLFILTANGWAGDSVTCEPPKLLPETMPEVYSLLTTVKNDILGTLPRFCRPDSYKQLTDEQPNEKALDNFVDTLKKLNIKGAKDTTKLDTRSETKMDSVIFSTVKTVVLKKIWQQSSDDNRYSMLISDDCGFIGLNRFPLHKNSKKVMPKNSDKEALKKAYGACKSTKFEEIAPFISKDVLAESLINLKNLFPESFPDLVQSMCGSLSEADSTLLAQDYYKDFEQTDRTPASAEEFSEWLKELFSSYNNADELSEEQEIIQSKITEAQEEGGNSYGGGGYSFGGFNYGSIIDMNQKQLKDAYDYQQANPDKKPTWGMIQGKIKKSSNGSYVIVKDPEVLKKQKEEMEKQKEYYKAQMKQAYEHFINDNSQKMKAMWDKAQPAEKVAVPDYKGVYIIKNDKGELVFEVDEKLKATLKSHIEKTLKTQTQLNMQSKKMMDDMMSNIDQASLKKIFALQEAAKEFDMLDQHMASYNIKVTLGADGKYKAEAQIMAGSGYGSYNSDDGENLDHYLEKIKVKDVPGLVLTTSGDLMATYKVKDGEFTSIELPSAMLKNASSNPYGVGASAGYAGGYYSPELLVTEAIKKKYQDKTAVPKKIKDLSSEELGALQAYTGSAYGQLNGCLRSDNCSDSQKKQITAINNALGKVRNDKTAPDDYQVLYRGTTDMPDFIYKALSEESEDLILDKGFMSTTGDIQVARQFARMGEDSNKLKPKQALFIMKTKSCVGISNISHYSAEDEFLCPPGLKFKVKKKEGSKNIYILEEK